MEKFGIGQPVRRREDHRLLTGAGCFVDDLRVADLAHGYVLRSPHAHAELLGVDLALAAAAPGVLAVYVAADLEAE